MKNVLYTSYRCHALDNTFDIRRHLVIGLRIVHVSQHGSHQVDDEDIIGISKETSTWSQDGAHSEPVELATNTIIEGFKALELPLRRWYGLLFQVGHGKRRCGLEKFDTMCLFYPFYLVLPVVMSRAEGQEISEEIHGVQILFNRQSHSPSLSRVLLEPLDFTITGKFSFCNTCFTDEFYLFWVIWILNQAQLFLHVHILDQVRSPRYTEKTSPGSYIVQLYTCKTIKYGSKKVKVTACYRRIACIYWARRKSVTVFKWQ